MRVALVHDYLNQFGGAERVFQEIAALFPRASIYTLIADPRIAQTLLPQRRIHVSSLARFGWLGRRHYYALWLMPYIVEQFDLSRFDAVISSSSSFAKGVLVAPGSVHVSYLATPLRYVWDDYHRDREEFPFSRWVRPAIPYGSHYLRLWDFAAAQRPDHLLTNSYYSSQRVQKYYGRASRVIYPPVDTQKFRHARYQIPDTKYFLMVGRLTPYKRFDLAVEAFNELGLPLWIVGDGPQRQILQRRARPNVRFLGWVGEERLPDLYAGAEAFIFPQEEHFGLVAVEAMAAGTPVIAFRGGGALEIVQEGRSGAFFDAQTPESLSRAVRAFRRDDFDPDAVRGSAARFDRLVFRDAFSRFLISLGLL